MYQWVAPEAFLGLSLGLSSPLFPALLPTYLLTPESVLIFFLYTVKFLMSQTFTVWSSLAERIMSPAVNTAALTVLPNKHKDRQRERQRVITPKYQYLLPYNDFKNK